MINTKLLNKKYISLLVFLFINFIFCIKYLSRVSSYSFVFSLFIIGFYFLLWFKKEPITSLLIKLKLSINLLLTLYFLVAIALLYFVPKESLNVDRWSVISSFWNNYFHNEYVYAAKSFDGNYPGPMPFYFILALPFYFIGELGLFSFLGILVCVFLLKKRNNSLENKVILFLLVATSLFYIWEICTRSNIFTNGSLILLSIVFFFKKYKKGWHSNLIFGALIGLMLSTRNVFVIPYLITFVFALKTKKIDLKNTCYLGIIALSLFILSFLPFVWNHFEDFKVMNPFIIQSSFLMPLQFSLLFIFIAFCLSFFCQEETDVYFYSGLSLFFTILFYFGFTIFNSSFKSAFYDSKADISYFILCMPFFIYSLFLNEKGTI